MASRSYILKHFSFVSIHVLILPVHSLSLPAGLSEGLLGPRLPALLHWTISEPQTVNVRSRCTCNETEAQLCTESSKQSRENRDGRARPVTTSPLWDCEESRARPGACQTPVSLAVPVQAVGLGQIAKLSEPKRLTSQSCCENCGSTLRNTQPGARRDGDRQTHHSAALPSLRPHSPSVGLGPSLPAAWTTFPSFFCGSSTLSPKSHPSPSSSSPPFSRRDLYSPLSPFERGIFAPLDIKQWSFFPQMSSGPALWISRWMMPSPCPLRSSLSSRGERQGCDWSVTWSSGSCERHPARVLWEHRGKIMTSSREDLSKEVTSPLGLDGWIGVHQEELGPREVLCGWSWVYGQEEEPNEAGKEARSQLKALRMLD